VELVASRLSGLAPGTVAVIELLAAGEPLGVPVLDKITNPAGLEDAEAQGFVQVYQDGRRTMARLAHPVYGEALRQSLPRSRLRRISATLASAIEATGARRREVGSMLIYEPDLIERGRAWLNVATGELSGACEILEAAADQAAAVRLRVAEARVLHDMARLGQPGAVAPRLAALAESTDGDLVPALAGHAAALVTGNASDLEAAGHALEALGAWLLAAEAYLAAAAAYRSDGYARPASALTRRAGELAALCGDVSSPGLSFGTQTGRLTRREREVAGMAAAGASSREIAAKLVLSVRTVDNHLQNAYSKLGVTSREELARVLRS